MIKKPTDDRTCRSCKHNVVKMIMNARFADGSPCTGVCGNWANTGIYYNSIFLTCDAWEEKNEPSEEVERE